jgi:RNA polymerase sigma factor (sigma-70 family)
MGYTDMNPADGELLADFAEHRSEAAFAALVARHLNLVYSTALRVVGESHGAEDVAQNVFLELARRAKSLPQATMLGGWLYRKTQYVSLSLLRSERQRRKREEIAMQMKDLNSASDSAWRALAPCLEEAMRRLRPQDQDVLLLRYFGGKSLREVGEALGLNDDAAQKRVSRALEKLRHVLARQGVAAPAAIVVAAIAGHAVHGAPASLASNVAALASAGTTAAGPAAVALKILETIAMTKMKLGLVAAIGLVAITTYTIIDHARPSAAPAVVAPLATDAVAAAEAPANPPAQMAAAAPRPGPATEPPANANPLKLTSEQIEKFLEQNQRSADSLLAAYLASTNAAYLKEAAEKYPTEPKVIFKIVTEKVFPAEQRQWLERFKVAAPDNSLPFYLSAADFFKTDQAESALQDLMQAHAKSSFNDFSREYIQDLEEIYRSSDVPVLLAQTGGMSAVGLNHLGPMKELCQQVLDYRQRYAAAGDTASSELLTETGLKLGSELSSGYGGMTLINQLVGIAIEKRFLGQLAPETVLSSTGKTVKERTDELVLLKQEIQSMAPAAMKLLISGFSGNQDLVNNYFSRLKMSGEYAAMKWVQPKLP